MEYSVWNRLSRGISALMHPFVIPTWAVLLMLYGPTVMVNMPPRVKFFLLGIVALNTLLLPAFSIGVLRWFRVIPDWSLQDQKTRMLPMGIVAVCYLMCIVAMSNMLFAFLITRFLIAALCCVAFAFFVNLYWKISLHMTAAGGLLGMLAVVCYAGVGQSPAGARRMPAAGRLARERPSAAGQPQFGPGRRRSRRRSGYLGGRYSFFLISKKMRIACRRFVCLVFEKNLSLLTIRLT